MDNVGIFRKVREGKPLPYDIADILHVAVGLGWWKYAGGYGIRPYDGIVAGGLGWWLFADSRGHRPYNKPFPLD